MSRCPTKPRSVNSATGWSDTGDQLFHLVNDYLQANGLKVGRGTLVDATIINAPSSTKNQGPARHPQGQPVVLWHEGAHRGGQQDQAGSQRGGHCDERP